MCMNVGSRMERMLKIINVKVWCQKSFCIRWNAWNATATATATYIRSNSFEWRHDRSLMMENSSALSVGMGIQMFQCRKEFIQEGVLLLDGLMTAYLALISIYKLDQTKSNFRNHCAKLFTIMS